MFLGHPDPLFRGTDPDPDLPFSHNKTEDNVPVLWSLMKGVGSGGGSGSGFISQRYGSGDTDPQHRP
jgi:hypothetical protein